jgi:hypothetical protein
MLPFLLSDFSKKINGQLRSKDSVFGWARTQRAVAQMSSPLVLSRLLIHLIIDLGLPPGDAKTLRLWRIKQLTSLILRFAKMYWQESAQ